MKSITDNDWDTVIRLAKEGKTIRSIAEELNINVATFWNILEQDNRIDEFYNARHKGYDTLADDIIDFPDQYSDLLRARVKIDAVKWHLSKMNPKKYSERVQLDVAERVDINAALEEAKRRALPRRSNKDEIEVKGREIIEKITDQSTDTVSDTDAIISEEEDIYR